MHLFVIPHWINLGFSCAVALIALWKGDWRAKAIALPGAVNSLLARTVCTAWCLTPWKSLTVDGVVLVACLAGVVGARRYWAIWAAAFAILAVISDLMGFAPGVSLWAWASASLIWTYMTGFAVLWGVWTTVRDRAAGAG